MKVKVRDNINTKEYLDKLYSGDWTSGYKDAYRRLDEIIAMLPRYPEHLDIGCADGYFTRTYNKKYSSTYGVGVDLSSVVVSQAKTLGGGEFMVANCHDLPFINNSFTLVHMGEILEHLDDPEKAINEAERVSKSMLVLTTPNNGGSNYEEHIWKWEPEDVLKMISFKPILVKRDFFNGDILLVIASR